MTEYRLENGDKIEAGKLYKTRDGRKAFIARTHKGWSSPIPIVGIIINEFRNISWRKDGRKNKEWESNEDLISLWPSESVTNCNQLGKIEVTDDLVTLAQTAYDFALTTHYSCRSVRMKAALEAVFTHIANQPEKPDSSIWDNFPPESPILDKLSDQIQSITYQVLEITSMIEAITEGIKEPKKQTLLEFAFRSEEKLSSTMLLDNLKPTRIFEIISRYLEQNK